MGRTANPYQGNLVLRVIVREPTQADLRAAYERCVSDKDRLPFEKALQDRAMAIGIRNTAREMIIRRGGR